MYIRDDHTAPASATEEVFLPVAQQSKSQRPVGRVGVVGLGRMGQAFAQTLLSSGFQINVHNRNPRRMEPFQLEGAMTAARLAD